MIMVLKVLTLSILFALQSQAERVISSSSYTTIMITTTSCITIPSPSTDSTFISSSSSVVKGGSMVTVYSGPVYVVTSYSSFCENEISIGSATRF